MGTRALWNIYPSSVRRWINRHGGLSRHMIFLQGRELHGFVPSCERTAAHADDALSAPLPRQPGTLRQRKRRQRPPLAPSRA